LLDINDNEISSGSVTVENDTNTAGTDYSRLIFPGATLTSKDDGYYSLEITYDTTNKVYSDVFCWETDVSEYLKIVATSTDILIGGYTLNMDGFIYTVYLDVNEPIDDYEINEEGVEKTYGDKGLFNSRNHISTFEITGYKATLSFLAGLRTVGLNGTVTLTYQGEGVEVYDIENPEKKETAGYGDVFLILDFKFKIADYLQTKNTV
jgi:hypothetical protein